MTTQTRKSHTAFVLFFSFILLIILNEVHANESKPYTFEEITVTANKHEEKLQKLPAAITVFTETDIKDANIQNLSDIINLVPNLRANEDNGFRNISIRGLSSSRYTSKNPVVIYIDGIPSDKVSFTDVDLNNVKRVEVLRGAQGVLYGKNAIGGIINIITKRPGNIVEGKIGTEISSHQTYGVNGYINAPIKKDELFFSLSGNFRDTDGYMKNDHPDEDTYDGFEEKSVRTRLDWLPTNRMEIGLTASLYDRSGDHTSTLYRDTTEVVYHSYKDPNDKLDKNVFNTSMNINYSFDDSELTFITTYAESKMDRSSKRIHEGATMIDGGMEPEITTGTQELRIQSSDQKSLRWMGGMFFSTEKTNYIDSFATFDTSAGLGYNTIMDWPGTTYEDTLAAFGEITIPAGKFKFTTGLRYERTSAELDYVYEERREDTHALVKNRASYNRQDDWDIFIPKGVISWDYNDNVMIYTSVAKGYLAGGYNFCEAKKEFAKIDNQTSMTYEMGLKTKSFNNRLILNASVYYMDIEDIHVMVEGIDSGTFIVSNAGAAHSQGIEVEAVLRIMRGLDIFAGLGIIDGEYDEYVFDKTTDYSGKDLTHTPKYNFNFGISYRHDSGFFAHADVFAYGDCYFNPSQTKKQDAYEIYNLKAGYETSSWEVYCYGKNIFDQKYFTNMATLHSVGAPRTIGIMAAIKF